MNLKAYSKALDVAMIKYHEERMTTVNKIIKQMWKFVYTGSDTKSIEIRTSATDGVGSARRTYNYKVVQTKHGHEIDMKGRCSAGQRVIFISSENSAIENDQFSNSWTPCSRF